MSLELIKIKKKARYSLMSVLKNMDLIEYSMKTSVFGIIK